MSNVVGSLVVNLSARTAQLTEGLRKAGGQIKGFASGTSTAMSSLRKGINSSTFKWGALGVTGAATAGLVKSVAAARESIQAENKLNSVLAATGNAAGFTGTQLISLASELQKVTNFEDDATVSAMAMLAAFRAIRGAVFTDAIKSAQDLATVTGTDLPSAVQQIGKVLNDPTSLGKMSKYFTPEQEKAITSQAKGGDVTGAQQKFLEGLNASIGGAAKAAADPLTQLGNAFDDIQEEIGKGLLPYLKMFGEAMLEQTNKLTSGVEELGGWTEAFGVVADVFSFVGNVAQILGGGFQALVGVIGEVVGWLTSWVSTSGGEVITEIATALKEAGKANMDAGAAWFTSQTPSERALAESKAAKAAEAAKAAKAGEPAERAAAYGDFGKAIDHAQLYDPMENLAELESLVEQYGKTPLKTFGETMGRLSEAFDAKLFGEGADAMEGYSRAMREATQSILGLPDLRSPMQQYKEKLNSIMEAARGGAIGIDDANRAKFDARSAAGVTTPLESFQWRKKDLDELLGAGAFGEGSDAMTNYNRALEESRASILGLPDMRTPMQGMIYQMGLYGQMLAEGAINQQEYDRLAMMSAQGIIGEVGFAKSASFGSAAASDAYYSDKLKDTKTDMQKDLVAAAKKQVVEAERHTRLLGDIAVNQGKQLEVVGALP
jgi:hypothetical protein